jgi:hypothetical protein
MAGRGIYQKQSPVFNVEIAFIDEDGFAIGRPENSEQEIERIAAKFGPQHTSAICRDDSQVTDSEGSPGKGRLTRGYVFRRRDSWECTWWGRDWAAKPAAGGSERWTNGRIMRDPAGLPL